MKNSEKKPETPMGKEMNMQELFSIHAEGMFTE